MDEYLAFAKDLARQGGKLIKEGFDTSLNVEIKSDNSPITQVDTAVNNLVIEAVKTHYPDHGVLGEESDLGSGHEELQWLCDPLDGTVAFIVGIPHSTFILGLTKANELLLSVVYDPFTDRLFHAVKGQGAFCNDELIEVNNQPVNGGYILVWRPTEQVYQALEESGAIMEVAPGAGYRSTLLASGRCTGIIQGSFDFHDVGPSSLIVEEAGGKVTGFDGSPMRFNQSSNQGIIFSNGIAHGQLVKIAQNSLK